MKLITLNKCLSGLDTIIYHDYKEENNNIRAILNDARKYIIESVKEHSTKEYNKRSFIVILQFINYLIQECFVPTFRFINHIIGLRFLITMFEENSLHINNDCIDFDEENGAFLKKYLIFEADDEDDE